MRIDSFKITSGKPARPYMLTTLLIRLYAFTLCLYPRSFRATFADEMLDVFAMTVREAESVLGVLGIFSRELMYLPFSLWQVRHQAFRQLSATSQKRVQARLAVRIVGALLGMFLLSTLSVLFSPSYHIYTLAVPFAAALFAATVSLLFGVAWGRVGGILTLISGAVMGICMTLYLYVIAVDQLGIVAVALIGLIWALPFLIFGLLFYQLSQPPKQQLTTG